MGDGKFVGFRVGEFEVETKFGGSLGNYALFDADEVGIGFAEVFHFYFT